MSTDSIIGRKISCENDDELLNQVQANWHVRLVPALAGIPDSTPVPVPGYWFVVAGNTPVGQVGSRWHPIQNLEVIQFSRKIATALESTITNAGVTQGRSRFWCYIPFNDVAVIVSTAHDGRGAMCVQMVVPVDVGVVRLGPEVNSTLSFPHGPTLQARLDNPSDIAAWANRWELDAREKRSEMAGRSVSNLEFVSALEGVVPEGKATTDRKKANRHAVLDRVAQRWVERSGGRRDGWSLLEAVAGYLDVDRRASSADREDQAVDDSGWVTRAKYRAHAALDGEH